MSAVYLQQCRRTACLGDCSCRPGGARWPRSRSMRITTASASACKITCCWQQQCRAGGVKYYNLPYHPIAGMLMSMHMTSRMATPRN
jgi:hypothetical protein